MMKANNDLRTAIFTSGLKHWEIAKLLGIHEATLARWLRSELPNEKKDQILQIIQNHGKAGEET